MTDLTVTLLPNGTAKPPGKAMALAFGYKGNRGIYGLNVAASGIWKGLTIRVCCPAQRRAAPTPCGCGHGKYRRKTCMHITTQ